MNRQEVKFAEMADAEGKASEDLDISFQSVALEGRFKTYIRRILCFLSRDQICEKKSVRHIGVPFCS